MSNRTVTCGGCGKVLSEHARSGDELGPCPKCGSTVKVFHEAIATTAIVYSEVRAKAKSPGRKRPTHEVVAGEVLQASGKWAKVERHIDRTNDTYSEEIVDPVTGAVLHECREPLHNHQGHGSAKGIDGQSGPGRGGP